MEERSLKRYAARVGYTESELETFRDGGHRIRQVARLSEAAARWSIEAEVVASRHCNSGHEKGQKLVMDVAGNFITKLCPAGCASISSRN